VTQNLVPESGLHQRLKLMNAKSGGESISRKTEKKKNSCMQIARTKS
jgi:hypothetical protein